MGKDDRRREPRYPVRNADLISVAVQTPGEKSDQPVIASLRDISRGGTKLQLSKPLRLSDAAFVLVRSEQLGLELSLPAEVCWLFEDKGNWLLGFEFAPRLPIGVLDTLLDSGVVERRVSCRQTKRIPITARWESDPTDHPAVLWDYSPGGFCLLSPSKATRKVRIWPENPPMEVAGATQWEIRMAGGYVVGCKFINDDGFDLLRALDPESPASHADEKAPRESSAKQKLRRLLDFFKRPALGGN